MNEKVGWAVQKSINILSPTCWREYPKGERGQPNK